MTLSFDDTPWIRSYAVWSQLAVEPPALDGGHLMSTRGQEAASDHRREQERDDRPTALPHGTSRT